MKEIDILNISLRLDDLCALKRLKRKGAVTNSSSTPEPYHRLTRFGLAEIKLCSSFNYAPGIVISPSGRDYLAYFPKIVRARISEKVWSLLMLILGAAATWGFQHLPTVISFLKSLFSR